MTDDKELIARLRESQAYEWQDPIWETRLAAADRIEALTEQLAAARDDAKAAEDELEMQEQEACMMENDYIKLEKERDALEAKLAQAVEGLHAVVQHEASTFFGSDGEKNKRASWRGVMRKVRATLATIKGKSHD